MINVAIIEDDKVFLERVSAVIGQSSYCKLVGVAHDFESGSRLIKETPFTSALSILACQMAMDAI